MALDRQLKHVVDKSEMHRLIDELEDGSCAVLVVGVKNEEGASSVDYRFCGEMPLWKGLGFMETAKQFMFMDVYDEDDGL